MNKPYEYFRFRWWSGANLRRISKELSGTFSVEWMFMPKNFREKLFASEWLKIRADTLTAYLFPLKAMLFQRKFAPFTGKDMELRKRILELYPQSRSSLISIGFVKEPKIPI
jgi:hypothetical protein